MVYDTVLESAWDLKFFVSFISYMALVWSLFFFFDGVFLVWFLAMNVSVCFIIRTQYVTAIITCYGGESLNFPAIL